MRVQSSNIFTQRVSELMKQNFLTKKDMAKRLNVDYSTFWRKLNGQRNVDMVLLKRIAEILGTSTAYLMGETDNSVPMPQSVEEEDYKINYAYWGGVLDNSQDLAKNGDKDTIVYVSQMLRRALSLLSSKIEVKTPLTPIGDKQSIANMPVIVGDHNESHLTVNPA